MKKSITMTKEEWVTEYHGFIDENEDVKLFLMDYFDGVCGSEPTSIKIIGKLYDSTVAWVRGGYNDIDDCIVCVWCELDINDNPDILIETYVWDKERRASVGIA